MKQLLAVTADLFFASKIRAALQSLPSEGDISQKWQAVFVRSAADFNTNLNSENKPSLVMLDLQLTQLNWEQLLSQARAVNVPVLAFGRHTEPQLLRRARELGAYRAVPNSTLVESFQELLDLGLAQEG